MIGDIPNYGTVWFNPQSMVNVLSLKQVCELHQVTMDSAVEATMCVHHLDGNIIKFSKFINSLYFHDVATVTKSNPACVSMAISSTTNNLATKTTTNLASTAITNLIFLTTVDANKAKFTPPQVKAADKARILYHKIGQPPQALFEHILNHNLIINCPITANNAKCANYIFGPNPTTVKGNMTKWSSHHIPSVVPTPIPSYIMSFIGMSCCA